MATLTFDGASIFGSATVARISVTHSAPNREQFDRGFPGIDGTIRLDMGYRSRTINVTGTMFDSYSGIKTLLNAIDDSYKAGTSGSLVITLGGDARTYTNTVLESFNAGPTQALQGSNALVPFNATFTQLAGF